MRTQDMEKRDVHRKATIRREKQARVRAAAAESPELSTAELAERFGVSQRVILEWLVAK